MVSIITPCYNKGAYISETIESVIKQTYDNWELIIVDDLSTDNSVKIIQENFFDERIKLIQNTTNKGANYSRNLAIKEARGNYIIFLDADDLLATNCLAERVKQIKNTNFHFCVFSMGTFKNKLGDFDYQWMPDSKNPLKDFLQHNLPWSILQPIWRKDFLVEIGGFDINFKRLQDVELHTRALITTDLKFKQFIGKPDCFYRIDEGRKTLNAYQFLNNWVESSLLYFSKFNKAEKNHNLNRYLIGTIFKTYLQVLFAYKTNRISTQELNELESKLLSDKILMTKFQRFLFTVCRFFNLSPIHFRGVNFGISKILVLNC